MKYWLGIILLSGLFVGGCVKAVTISQTASFDAPDAASRMYAIRQAGDKRDWQAVGHLIDLLDSADPAERMLTISALTRITGERMGYEPYQDNRARSQAIKRWFHAFKTGKLHLVKGGSLRDD